MRQLLRGNETFRKHYVAREREFLRRLADTPQSPSTLYIGCSDSRVVPELLTGTGPGEIFVVRNVANVVPAEGKPNVSVGAAIEYGVGVLRVEHIVVCGHLQCAGIKAILDGVEQLRALPSLHEWLLGAAADVLAEHDPHVGEAQAWADAVGRNVLAQLDHLRTFPVVAAAMAAGKLELHGWVYDLARGAVRVYDAEAARFVDASDIL